MINSNKVIIFGSCRVNKSLNETYKLAEETSYSHSISETKQLIQYCLGNLEMESPYDEYCFECNTGKKP